jgi:hypothetical protein
MSALLITIAQAAFLFAYDVDRGKEGAFEAGYAAHLGWHAEHGDTLPWYGWYVTSGPRTGLFIDGTFGIPFAAMDQRADPAGDGADMTARVLPFAKARTYSALEFWPEVSTARTLEDRKPTAVLDAFTVTVAPAKVAAFETALRAEPGRQPIAWYRTVSGGSAGAYLALVPRQGWTDLADLPRGPAGLLGKAAALTETVEVETWSYRPKLSRVP